MLVVGLDLGTQSIKAVVCDEQMSVLGSHSVKCTTSYPGPDQAEQDPAMWDAALAPAIAGALKQAGAKREDIAALAVSGQLDGCIVVDANGAPVHPALIWQDRRATPEVEQALSRLERAVDIDRGKVGRAGGRVEQANTGARALFERTGQVADASHMAAKIAWLRRELANRSHQFHQPVSYVVERLCGEAVMDPALASTTMLLSLVDGRWDQTLLDAFEITAGMLPRIAPACSIAGTITEAGAKRSGLRVGTPVAVGSGDDFCTPLGAGVIAPDRTLVCAIGTAEVVGALSADRVLDGAGEPMVETHLYPTGAFFIENPGWLSGGAVRWALRALAIDNDAELDKLAASAPPGCEGVTFIPALAGAMTPVWRPHARGGFYGLSPSHERSHLARAVLEGLAFACRDVADRLAAMGLPTDRTLLLGGGSRSDTWAQIRADVLGKPHDIAWGADTCPVGAAMIASVAAGIHEDLASAAAQLPPPSKSFAPGARLDDAYARYQRLVRELASIASSPWR